MSKLDKHAFKQRLIGAIVLIALAVIFIPILLPGHRDLGFSDTESHIPPKPDELENLKVLELEKPIPAPAPREIVRTPIDERSPPAPTAESEAPAVEQKPATADKKPSAPPVKETKSDAASTSKAWVVQVGSFSKRDNALRLRDQLRSKGYKTFVEQISTADKTFYRVRVGPVISRSNAVALQKELQTKMKLQDTAVVSHP
ncbi:MAG: sporulation protein [Halobacteria archaeon]|nr:sporulation protein [Halobacteria archaeon]